MDWTLNAIIWLLKNVTISKHQLRIILILTVIGLLLQFLLTGFREEQINEDSGHVYKLKKQIEKLDMENNILHTQIYYYESYRVIDQEARKMGFIDAGDPIIIRPH